MSAADLVQAPKAKRSQFVDKLHDLLEHPHDPDSLRWSPDGTAFEITTHEAKAKAALSPKWDFRSLSSFIRQLSYYNFKRLSDRRRSTERRGSATSYIVFHHPTGFFVRGDSSRLDGIIRKTRPKTPQSRRQSLASNLSTDDSLPSVPAAATWAAGPSDGAQAGPSGLPSPSSPFSYDPVPGLAKSYQGPPATHDPAWRPYHSTGWPPAPAPAPYVQQQQVYGLAPGPGSFPPAGYDPTLPPVDQQHALRRSSLSEFKISPEPKVPDLQQAAAHRQAYVPSAVGQMQEPPPPHAFPAQPYAMPAYPPHAPPQPPFDQYQYQQPQHLPADPHSPVYPFPFDPNQPRGSGSSYGTSFSSRSSGQSLVPSLHPQARLSIAAGAVPSPPYSYSSAEDDGSVPPQGSYPPSRQGEYPPPPPPHAPQQHVDHRRGSVHDPSAAVDPHHPQPPPLDHQQQHHPRPHPHHHQQLAPLPLHPQQQQFNPSPAALPPAPQQQQPVQSEYETGAPTLHHPRPQHQTMVDWRQSAEDPAGHFGAWAGFGGAGAGAGGGAAGGEAMQGGGKEDANEGEAETGGV